MNTDRKVRLNIAVKLYAAKVAMQSRLPSTNKQSGKSLAKEALTLANTLIKMEAEMFGDDGT